MFEGAYRLIVSGIDAELCAGLLYRENGDYQVRMEDPATGVVAYRLTPVQADEFLVKLHQVFSFAESDPSFQAEVMRWLWPQLPPDQVLTVTRRLYERMTEHVA